MKIVRKNLMEVLQLLNHQHPGNICLAKEKHITKQTFRYNKSENLPHPLTFRYLAKDLVLTRLHGRGGKSLAREDYKELGFFIDYISGRNPAMLVDEALVDEAQR